MGEMRSEIFVYDINIIYNHARSRFSGTDDTKLSTEFAEYIIQKVESWGYRKTFYHDRDALPGKNMFTELFRIIKESKFTLVILSPGFLKNCWAKYCHLAAFKTLLDKENSDKLIPVVLGLKDEDIPPNLKLSNIISFDPGSWKDNSRENKREWQKLQCHLAEDNFKGHNEGRGDNALPNPRNMMNRPVQESEPPGQLPSSKSHSKYREQDLDSQANLQSGSPSASNDSSLFMDGALTDTRETGDGAEAKHENVKETRQQRTSEESDEDTIVKEPSISTGNHIASGGASGSNSVTVTQLISGNQTQRKGTDDTDNGRQKTDKKSKSTKGREQITAMAASKTSTMQQNSSTAAQSSKSRSNYSAHPRNALDQSVGNSLDSTDLSYDNGSYSSRHNHDQTTNQTDKQTSEKRAADQQREETRKEHDEARNLRNYVRFEKPSSVVETNKQATRKLQSNQDDVAHTPVAPSLTREKICKNSTNKTNSVQCPNIPGETSFNEDQSFDIISVREQTPSQHSTSNDSHDTSKQNVSKQAPKQIMTKKQREQESDFSGNSGNGTLDPLSIHSKDNACFDGTGGKVSKLKLSGGAKGTQDEQKCDTVEQSARKSQNNIKDMLPGEEPTVNRTPCRQYQEDTSSIGQCPESELDTAAGTEGPKSQGASSQRSTLQQIGNFISGTFIRMVTNPDQPFLG